VLQTKLSKALIKDASKIQVRTEEQYKSAGVEFHLETEVVSVDFEGHRVKTKDGKDWDYSRVVFATGGNPRRLPMQGFKTLGNVFVLRGIDDVERILAAVGDNKKKIVIVGTYRPWLQTRLEKPDD
jgi:NADPH-dependent 2,4-dienoyl-CoA reductase/sulfur reductase-like enzyme